MKKYLVSLLVVAILIVATASMASANGGPHGGYTATTDACAGCHRAHTATGPSLLMAANTSNLCLSCHGAAGSGANTNVEAGKYLSTRDDAGGNWNHGAANTPDNANLLGGVFTTGMTSAHTYDGTSVAAWGDGVARGATGAAAAMDCASCHDPHGSTNYRIIKTTINGVTPVTVAQVDEASKDYDTEQWGAGQSAVCAACHADYHQTAAGQGSILDGATYTHRVDMTVGALVTSLPLSGTNVVCQTCHFPHGTTATMTTLAGGPNTAGDSALLRMDNRGVCEDCHDK